MKQTKNHFLTLFLYTAPLLYATTGNLSADEDADIRNLEYRINYLEKRKASIGVVNPSPRPIVEHGLNLLLQADVLLWQVSESDMGYAIINENGTDFVNDGRVLKPHFEWDWGFKAAVGYTLPHDSWDLFFQWTRFFTDNSENGVTADENEIIFPTYVNAALPLTNVPGSILSGFQSASSFWNLQLQILDFELGREFYVGQHLTLRPHADLRTAWIRQKYKITYKNGATIGEGRFLPIIPVSGQTIAVHMTNNFWGMGLRGGFDSDWKFGCGLSVFGDFAAAILLGYFKISQHETRTTVTPIETRLKINEHVDAARVTLDMAMGLRYEHLLAEDRYNLMLQLAWEQHTFFNQNQLMKFPSSSILAAGRNFSGLFVSSEGDLSTQGITISARFDF